MVLPLVILGTVAVWLWMSHRDPLIHLVPVALAVPPLLAYGGQALGWPGGWLSTRVALVGCIALHGAQRVVRSNYSFRSIPFAWFILPYPAIVIASVIWGSLVYNDDVSAIANEFVTWLVPLIIFLLILGERRGERDVRHTRQALGVVGISISAYCVLQGLVLAGYDRFVPMPIFDITEFGRRDLLFGSFRLYGTFPNLGPNFLGFFLIAPTVVALNACMDHRPRLGWLFAAITGGAVILGTYSRGAILGLLTSLLLLPVWRRSKAGVAIAATAVVVGGVAIAGTPVGRYVRSLYTSGQLDVSGSARIYLWRTIAATSVEYPIGRGFNGWLRASRKSEEVGLADPPETLGSPRPAENQWMRELADRGPLGVMALALLLGGTLFVTYRRSSLTRRPGTGREFIVSAGSIFGGWAIAFLTGDHLMYESTAGMFWYVLAVCLATIRDADPPIPAKGPIAGSSI